MGFFFFLFIFIGTEIEKGTSYEIEKGTYVQEIEKKIQKRYIFSVFELLTKNAKMDRKHSILIY